MRIEEINGDEVIYMRRTGFDDRGCPPGTIFMDMVTVSEKMMNDDDKENWKWIFYDGDRITAV